MKATKPEETTNEYLFEDGSYWNLADVSQDFNKNIVANTEENAKQGSHQPRLNTTETFANYLSKISMKNNTGPIIIYFNSCSPSHTQETLPKTRDSYAMRGKRLLQIQSLRSDIQKIGRQNFCYLRKNVSIRGTPLNDFPNMFTDDLPRHTHGYARMGDDERHDWYENHIGHYFKMLRDEGNKKSSSNLRKPAYIGLSSGDMWDAQKALNDIYEEAKMDQSGVLLKRLYERYKSERINHISMWMDFKNKGKIKEIPLWKSDWYPGRALVINKAVVGGKRKRRRTHKKHKRKHRRTRKKK